MVRASVVNESLLSEVHKLGLIISQYFFSSKCLWSSRNAKTKAIGLFETLCVCQLEKRKAVAFFQKIYSDEGQLDIGRYNNK